MAEHVCFKCCTVEPNYEEMDDGSRICEVCGEDGVLFVNEMMEFIHAMYKLGAVLQEHGEFMGVTEVPDYEALLAQAGYDLDDFGFSFDPEEEDDDDKGTLH